RAMERYYARRQDQDHRVDIMAARTCRSPGFPRSPASPCPAVGNPPGGSQLATVRDRPRQHLTHTHATSSAHLATPTAGAPRSMISGGKLDPGPHRRGGGRTAGPHWAAEQRVQVAELRWSLPHGATRPLPLRPTGSPNIG